MIANSPAAVAAAFSSNSSPVAPGDSRCAAIPDPITTAARNALPSNSASSRRHSATSFTAAPRSAPARRARRVPGPPAAPASARIRPSSLICVDADKRSLPAWIDNRQDRSMSMQPARATLDLIPVVAGRMPRRARSRWSVSRSARARRPGWRRCSRPSATRSGCGCVSLIGAHQGGEVVRLRPDHGVRPDPAHHQPPPEGAARSRDHHQRAPRHLGLLPAGARRAGADGRGCCPVPGS